MFRVDIDTSDDDASSGHETYTYEYSSESEAEIAKRELAERAQRLRAKLLKKGNWRTTMAKGDLGVVEEKEEDWEKYQEAGGDKDHDQFCRDSMVAGYEDYLKKALKIRPEAT